MSKGGKTPKVYEESTGNFKQDPANANRGTPRGDEMLEHSIQTVGLGRSVVVTNDDVIIAGNKTVQKAGELGIEDAIVVESDGTKLIVVKRTDLDLETDPRAKEYALLDNRVGQVNLEWDGEILSTLKDEGIDMSGMFFPGEFDLITSQRDDADPGAAPPPQANDGLVHCPRCGHEFEEQA